MPRRFDSVEDRRAYERETKAKQRRAAKPDAPAATSTLPHIAENVDNRPRESMADFRARREDKEVWTKVGESDGRRSIGDEAALAEQRDLRIDEDGGYWQKRPVDMDDGELARHHLESRDIYVSADARPELEAQARGEKVGYFTNFGPSVDDQRTVAVVEHGPLKIEVAGLDDEDLGDLRDRLDLSRDPRRPS